MATLGDDLLTLADLTKRLDPDGKIAMIGEHLEKTNAILDHMVWKEGNLPTGERTTVRVGNPTVGFRALNEGIARSKSRTAQVDEGAAMLAGFSECDRDLAVLSGDVGGFRVSESKSFFEAMNQTMATTLFYGNAATSRKEFSGLATRYDDLSSSDVSDQIIDGGGTGIDNRSIWFVAWGETGVQGIYPKGSKAGLQHMDVTNAQGSAGDGYPAGCVIEDDSGRKYLGFRDWYQWHCGLSVKDKRYAVRIANIDYSALTADHSAGAYIENLMVQAEERMHQLGLGSMKYAWYCPRKIHTYLRLQMLTDKRSFMSWDEIGGKRVELWNGTPIHRIDALNVDEARVV